MNLKPYVLDDQTVVIYLLVPGSQVVLLQAFFEAYEGIGTVRTLDIRSSLVCVLTTPSMLEDCRALLNSIRDRVEWRPAEPPEAGQVKKLFGYFRRENTDA